MHEQTDFDSYRFDPSLLDAVREAGMLTPTSLQRAVFPPLLEGRDLVLQAVTGTGRTLSWCLPMVQRLLSREDGGGAVVVVSSNEGGLSVDRELRRLVRDVELSMLMPAAGVERSGASYDMFGDGEDVPDILVGRAPSIGHFTRGTEYPLEKLSVFVAALSGSLDEEERRALEEMIARLPDGCQRVLVSDDPDTVGAFLEGPLLRSPAMVMGTAPAPEIPSEPGPTPREAPSAPEPEPEARPAPRPASRTRPSRTRRRPSSSDRPESWPIAHIGITSPAQATHEELARVVLVHASGHTLVLVTSRDGTDELKARIEELVGNLPVNVLEDAREYQESDDASITIAHVSAREHKKLTANVLVLESFPTGVDHYLSCIPLMRCDPGDSIISIVTPRDVSNQYQLRLVSGIRLLERRMPTVQEVEGNRQAERLLALRSLADDAGERDLDLLARVRTMGQGDGILAVALRRLLESQGEDRGGRSGQGGGEAEPEAPRGAPADGGRGKKAPRRRRTGGQEDRPAPEASTGRSEERKPLLRGPEGELPRRGAGRRGGVPMVELQMSCGEDEGVDEDYLVHWLQSRLAMGVSELGPIRIHDHRTILTVPRERAEEAVRVLSDLSFGECEPEVKVLEGSERRRS